MLCAALLHDTIEDTETTLDELRERFGERVASIVLEVTDDTSLDKHERKRRQIEHAPHLSREAALVKLADKISNLRDVATSPPPDWSLARRQEYFDWAHHVIDGVRGVHPKLEGLFDVAYSARPTSDPSNAAHHRTLVGVDGCKAGWLAVSRQRNDTTLQLGVFGSARELLDHFGTDAVVAVDIPMGLSDAGPRSADVLARKRLGGARASSVFPTPIRPILDAATRAEASEIHRSIDGRGFGAQSFAILPKIREWDRLLRADPLARAAVREIHPEVCFSEINGGTAFAPGKRTYEGFALRRRILARYFGEATIALLEAQLNRRQVARDDLMDALVALWSAERIAAGCARSLPETPETDGEGLMRAIWF